MLKYLAILSAMLGVCAVNAANASMVEGDAKLGQQKAYTCQFCHGANGYAPRPDYPNINGQNALYLFNAMKAYQDGKRSGPMGNMMRQQMSVLNDQDMKDIAAFYAEQRRGKPE